MAVALAVVAAVVAAAVVVGSQGSGAGCRASVVVIAMESRTAMGLSL